MTIICIDWTTSDKINFLILIVYTITAYFIYKTFAEGRKQTNRALAINQFNIFNDELKSFIDDGKKIKFKSDLNEDLKESYKFALQVSDGILYIELFSILWILKSLKNNNSEEEERKVTSTMNDFRHNVLFPLERYYDRLLHFLQSVKVDTTMEEYYKEIIYTKVERDILQTYFRICNCTLANISKLDYDISIFSTSMYDTTSFYRINDFYKENKIFQYKDLTFYQRTS